MDSIVVATCIDLQRSLWQGCGTFSAEITRNGRIVELLSVRRKEADLSKKSVPRLPVVGRGARGQADLLAL
jgi:hypothetical protein